MDASYRIEVKIGDAAFSAEGPEKTVKEAYESFLKAISPQPTKQPTAREPAGNTPLETNQELLDRVFVREDDMLSLQHLPDGPDRGAD